MIGPWNKVLAWADFDAGKIVNTNGADWAVNGSNELEQTVSSNARLMYYNEPLLVGAAGVRIDFETKYDDADGMLFVGLGLTGETNWAFNIGDKPFVAAQQAAGNTEYGSGFLGNWFYEPDANDYEADWVTHTWTMVGGASTGTINGVESGVQLSDRPYQWFDTFSLMSHSNVPIWVRNVNVYRTPFPTSVEP